MTDGDTKNPTQPTAAARTVQQRVYHRLLESAGFVVLHIDSAGRITAANDALTDLTGHLPGAVVGEPLLTLIAPPHQQMVQAAVTDGELLSRLIEVIDTDGGLVQVEQSLIPHDDETVEVVWRAGTAAGLEADLARAEAVVNEPGDVMILYEDAQVVDVNAAFTALTGYSRQDARGLSLDVLLPPAVNAGLIERLHEKRAYPVSGILIRQDGDYLPVEMRSGRLYFRGRMLEVIIVRDIRDRLKQEQYVQASSRFYRTLVRSLPNTAMLIFDAGMRYLIVEGELPHVPGFLRQITEGRTLYDMPLTDEQIERMETFFRAALDGRQGQHEIYHQDRYLRLQFVPIQDGSEEVVAGMMVMRDVTEHRRTLMALRENEQRFRGLFDHNNDAVFFIDLDGRIFDLNQQALDLLRSTRESQIGRLAQENTVDAPVDAEPSRMADRLFKGERVPIYRRMFRRDDGTSFPAEINVSLVTRADGSASHIQSIVRDISDRDQVEEQLQARIEQLTTLRLVDEELSDRLDVNYVLTMGLDSTVRLSTANAGFISLMSDDGTIVPVAVMGVYEAGGPRVDYRPDAPGVVAQVVRTGRPALIEDVSQASNYVPLRQTTVAQIVVPLIARDEVMGVLNLESDRAGKFTEDVFDVVKLITRRIAVAVDNARLYRQTQEQLDQLRDLYGQVSTLEQLKTDMIRVAAHDLRNPLSAIIGHIELISMDIDDAVFPSDLAKHVEPIGTAAERMRRIIDDILSLERIEKAVQDAEYPPVNLLRLVVETYNENLPQALARGKRLELDLPDEETVMVRGEAVELHEVLNNLIENAMKYTGDDGHIRVRLHADERSARVEVIDNGYGIPEEKQAKLFQAFYRVQTKETSNIKGTGLGLHLVKNIIDRHHGGMIVESVYKQGSTFGFRLPVIPNDGP